MYDYEVLEENPVSIAEAKEHIKKVPTKDMTFEQKQAYDHIKKMTKLKPKDAKAMKKELEELGIRKLKELHIVRIIDILPKDEKEIDFILKDTNTSFEDEEKAKIMSIVKKYA